MNYHEEVIIDFARRTRANLEYIEAAKGSGEDIFEVTQLANSLLGLLVFPQQRYIDCIPKTPLSELVSHGWPVIHTTFGKLPKENLYQLIRMLRNSVAHCNILFIASSESQLCKVRVWNMCEVKIRLEGKLRKVPWKSWEAELSFDDLRVIAFKFSNLLERIVGQISEGGK